MGIYHCSSLLITEPQCLVTVHSLVVWGTSWALSQRDSVYQLSTSSYKHQSRRGSGKLRTSLFYLCLFQFRSISQHWISLFPILLGALSPAQSLPTSSGVLISAAIDTQLAAALVLSFSAPQCFSSSSQHVSNSASQLSGDKFDLTVYIWLFVDFSPFSVMFIYSQITFHGRVLLGICQLYSSYDMFLHGLESHSNKDWLYLLLPALQQQKHGTIHDKNHQEPPS